MMLWPSVAVGIWYQWRLGGGGDKKHVRRLDSVRQRAEHRRQSVAVLNGPSIRRGEQSTVAREWESLKWKATQEFCSLCRCPHCLRGRRG